MKLFRIIIWLTIAVMAAFLAWQTFSPQKKSSGTKLGAPFTLTTTDAKQISHKNFLGRPHLVFFGFTHCPEVCPTTLFEASGWLAHLGDDADKLDMYFISVDPERDTQELMASYMSAFDTRIVGLTGSLEETEKATKGYHVYYKKVELEDGDYTVDHTASVFLMRADGTFKGTITWGENFDVAIKKIKNLLKD